MATQALPTMMSKPQQIHKIEGMNAPTFKHAPQIHEVECKIVYLFEVLLFGFVMLETQAYCWCTSLRSALECVVYWDSRRRSQCLCVCVALSPEGCPAWGSGKASHWPEGQPGAHLPEGCRVSPACASVVSVWSARGLFEHVPSCIRMFKKSIGEAC